MTRTFFLSLLLGLAANVFAQDISYGFKAGLNFNTFQSDGEMDADGNTIEEFTSNTGFLVGATFTWKATELMGLRAELLYSQKGGRRSFDGPGYYIFTTNSGQRVVSFGNRDQNLNVTLSYIDLPVMGYFKPLQWLEIYGGASVGIRVAASGFGSVTYSGRAPNGSPIAEFVHDFDANFVADDPGEARFADPPASVTIGNDNALLPSNAGAYFEFENDRGSLYSPLDFGVLGGISIFLNQGFYVSGRVNYGLSDITRSKADVSLNQLDNGQFISRNDDDRNLSIQACVGFSF